MTHRHDLFYKTVKYHDYIPKEYASETRRNNSGSMKARVVILVSDTQGHDLFYITVKYHDYIPKGIQVTERTGICMKKHQRGDNSKC